MTLPAARLPADPFAALADLPGVRDAVAAARDDVDRLLGHRLLRRRSAEVTAESALRGARASAELEGAHIELERLRGQLLAGSPVELHDRADLRGARLVASAVRLHADLGALLGPWRRSPRQALARLHVLAAADLVTDPDRLGRPRGGPPADGPPGQGPAPDPVEVSARLDGLFALLAQPTSAPAVVVSAVVHGELLALRPFGVADGLVARAAARLVLVDRGLDPKAVTAPEVGHAELEKFGEGGFARDHGRIDGVAYSAALRAYVGGGPDGVATWVVHCARAVALGAREGLAVCQAVSRG